LEAQELNIKKQEIVVKEEREKQGRKVGVRRSLPLIT
jgi:hypothetical protein